MIFIDLIFFEYYGSYVFNTFYVTILLFYYYFLRLLLFNTFIIFAIIIFKTTKSLSRAVASPSTLKAGIASSPLFSLLDLSWSRSVARHAIRKVCDCVLPHSTLPLSGSKVSGLLSQLWT